MTFSNQYTPLQQTYFQPVFFILLRLKRVTNAVFTFFFPHFILSSIFFLRLYLHSCRKKKQPVPYFFHAFFSLFSWNVECLFALCPWILLFILLLHLNLAVARKIPAQANINWQMNSTCVPFSFSFSVCVSVYNQVQFVCDDNTFVFSAGYLDQWCDDFEYTFSSCVLNCFGFTCAHRIYIRRLWHECSCSCSLFIVLVRRKQNTICCLDIQNNGSKCTSNISTMKNECVLHTVECLTFAETTKEPVSQQNVQIIYTNFDVHN